MYILQIEHPVPNFEWWKKVFDSDPLNRKASGVRRYKISRKVDEPNYIVIDLDFDTLKEAEACQAKLQNLWTRVEGSVMNNPQSRIIEVIENKNV